MVGRCPTTSGTDGVKRQSAFNPESFSDALSAAEAKGQQFEQVYFVACGASLADLYPSRYFLDRESRQLRTAGYSSNEFVHAEPAALDHGSLVVVCSHSGGTAETVQAAKLARESGAFVVTLTHNQQSDLAPHSDYSILYDWGEQSRVDDNPMAVALAISAETLKRIEGYVGYTDFRNAMEQVNNLVQAARERVRGRSEEFAAASADESLYYVLSSGASYGHARSFAGSGLMEMQWLDASAIHTGEFFHGPFEITSRAKNFFLLKNEGCTRPLDQRAEDFLRQYAGQLEVIDARQLGISALAAGVVDYFNPILFYSVLCEYRDALARVRRHPIDTRRYMGKVDY